MFDDVNSSSISSEAQNAPNLSFAANPVLGNMEFNIQAPQSKRTIVQPGFPTFPYISIESLLFFQMMDNPNVNPVFVTNGQTTGQQSVSGQITQSDSAGTTRYSQGTVLGGNVQGTAA